MSRKDQGFTLIEMLVALTIIGIVGVLFAMAAADGFQITGQSSASLADSGNRETLTSRLILDVESATTLTQPSTNPCLPDAPRPELVVTTPSMTVVYYATQPDGADDAQLDRVTCEGTDVVTPTLVAQWPSDSTPTVSFTCTGSPFRQVSIVIPSADANSIGSDQPFTLTVSRRTTP